MVLFFFLLVVGKSQYLSLKNRLNKVYYAHLGVGEPNQEFEIPISSYSPVNVNSSLICRCLAQEYAKVAIISITFSPPPIHN